MSVRSQEMFLYRGRSMWPGFQAGDLLETEPVTPDAVRAGDCLVFVDGTGRQVVHRVVMARNVLRTRGDAMGETDHHGTSPPQLLGRVVRRYRSGSASRIGGGHWGRAAGLFYRYAGRIDPERNARGGRVARGIGHLCQPLSRWLLKRSNVLFFQGAGEEELVICRWGRNALARRQGAGGTWQVYWPWRIVFVPPGN